MGMVGQDRPCVDVERTASTRQPHGFAECGDMFSEQVAAAIEQAHREKEGPAGDAVIAVVEHGLAGTARARRLRSTSFQES